MESPLFILQPDDENDEDAETDKNDEKTEKRNMFNWRHLDNAE